jgi:DNA helicase-2/ATP-dependent DNA helicase PcrA
VKIQLDFQQKKAVETDSHRALVIAGAGSGKTRVLTERIAYLIEQQKISPYETLAFTFTRKAAGEVKERLITRLKSGAYNITMGTMHAVALNLIHRFGEMIGLRATNVTVYGEWEEKFLLKEVAADLGFFKKTWKIPKKTVGDGSSVDEMFAEYYQRGSEPDPAHPGYRLFKAFIDRCRENNALTYGSLLTGLELLIPMISKYLHFRHILVDETQDIDPLQWRIINKLCEAFNASLFVVGDIDQSIFEFRGAVPSYLIEHQNEFDIYRLEKNYRSVSWIVWAANELIKNNTQRLEKKMVNHRVGNDDRKQNISIDRDVDSQKLVGTLNEYDPDNCNVAVLSRQHILLQKLSQLLDEQEIKHTYIGQKTALTNSESFRRFHAFFKLLVNPYDNFSFLLIRDVIGLSRRQYAEIRFMAAAGGQSHFEIWKESSKDPPLYFFKYSPFEPLSHLATDDDVFGIPYLPSDIEEITNFMGQWVEKNPTGTIAEYLDWLATYDLQDEIKETSGGLQLMTIHAAKGLEWPTVIIAGVNEGLLPSKQAIANGEIEAERRLAYVAWTRAEDKLILTVRPQAKQAESGHLYHNPISRFIEESNI